MTSLKFVLGFLFVIIFIQSSRIYAQTEDDGEIEAGGESTVKTEHGHVLEKGDAEKHDKSGNENDEVSENSGISNDAVESNTIEKPRKPAKNVTKIDWAEIERKWNEADSDDEVRRKWLKIDRGLKSGIRAAISAIFPKVAGAMATDAKVSGNCSAGILKWIVSLRYLKDWAVKMVDAMGKPPAGILEGAVTSFGNYHECVKVRVPDDEDEDDEDLFAEEEDEEKNKKPKEFKEFFRGKYCSLEFKPSLPEKPRFYGFETRLPAIPKFPEKENVLNTFSQWAVFLNFIALRFDICIPSLCTKDDLQKILNLVQKLSEVRARVLRCEVEEDTTHISHIQVTTMLLFIVLFFSFGFLTVFGICLGRCKIQSPIINFLKSLTWTHACRELTHTESYNKGHKIAPLYGLRFIFMFWIILVHMMVIVNFQFFRDVMPLKDLALSWAAQIMTKSALQFESLIIITAFCIAYYNEDGGFMKAIKQLIRKYFRIMPIVMVTTGIMILLPLAKKSLLGGPTWNDFVPQPSQACQEYGYINLFFIQNFQPPDQMCLPQTWLFCVEMQLALVFVPIMGFVSHFKRSSYLILAALVVAGFAINFYTVYHNNLPPTLMWTLPDPQQRNLYYRVHFFKPWSHLSTFAIGIAAGHYCHNRNRRNYANLPSIHKSLNYQSVARYLIGLICFGAMFACINLFPSWVLGNLPGPILSGVFDGLSKIVWSLCMAFFLYAVTLKVEEEKQSLITRALSSNAYIILGRLTLNAFILHPIVQIVFLATQQAQLFTSMIIAMYSLLGNTVVTYAFSFVLAILFELPLTSLLTARDSSLAYTRQNQNKMMAGNVLGSSNMIMRNGDIEMTKERF